MSCDTRKHDHKKLPGYNTHQENRKKRKQRTECEPDLERIAFAVAIDDDLVLEEDRHVAEAPFGRPPMASGWGLIDMPMRRIETANPVTVACNPGGSVCFR